MWEYEINESEKIVIFVGGMNAISLKLEELDSFNEASDEDDLVKRFEKQKDFADFQEKKLLELRSRIVDALNKSGDAKEIRDMFEENLPADLLEIDPIMFILHLPFSLQKMSHDMSGNIRVEDFFVVYNGEILLIAAICPINKMSWGVLDVRNRLFSLVKSVVPNIEITAPCLTPGGILYAKKLASIPESESFNFVLRESEGTVLDVLSSLYLEMSEELRIFYESCKIREDTNAIVIEIREHEAELLSNLNKFLSSTWKHPFQRMKIVDQLKLDSAKILEKLSEHASNLIVLSESINSIKEQRAGNRLFDEFLKKINLEHYTQPIPINVDSLIRVIEHTRSETNEYGASTSTIVSAVGGAVIGSVLTIVFSYLLGFL